MYNVFYLPTVQKTKITILLRNYKFDDYYYRGENKRFSYDVCTDIIIYLLYFERFINRCVICTYYVIYIIISSTSTDYEYIYIYIYI
jgi:hypothetical protein